MLASEGHGHLRSRFDPTGPAVCNDSSGWKRGAALADRAAASRVVSYCFLEPCPVSPRERKRIAAAAPLSWRINQALHERDRTSNLHAFPAAVG